MKIEFTEILNINNEVLVILLDEELKINQEVEKYKGLITTALDFGTFHGKKNESFMTLTGDKDAPAILLYGLGNIKNMDENSLMKSGGRIYYELNRLRIQKAVIINGTELKINNLSSNLAFGAVLRSYKFGKYFTKQKPEDQPSLTNLSLFTKNVSEEQTHFSNMEKIADGIFLTRDLVSEPPNVLYPESFAAKCLELTKFGLKVEVLEEPDIEKLGMGALIGVAQGSVKPPRVVVINWQGGKEADQPIAFVGKGVTFDTGGISLKPAAGMEDMKYDMGGAGLITGLMQVLATRKAKVNAVAVLALVENMPDGNAQRPSDVVTSMSGQTIEVLNTDAEGRLILADVLWYCQDRFKPKYMIDLATLTGAITVTFGSLYCGLFSNNDELAEMITESGKQTHEKFWRLPLDEGYDKYLVSQIADIQNISNDKGAGSIIAAQFLQKFVNDVPWVHLDIAGVTWTKKDLDITPKGSTAFGLMTLNKFIEKYCENLN